MKSLFLVGGPLIACIGFGFYSGLLEAVEAHPGLEHAAGVQPGGTFAIEHQETYQCDENGNNCVLIDEKTEISEIDGLELEGDLKDYGKLPAPNGDLEFTEVSGLELEEQPIEYRNGSEDIVTIKMPGIPKYSHIVMKRPSGFNWKSLTFDFQE